MTRLSTCFEFATAARVIFGSGALAQCPAVVGALGRRVLVVTGASPQRAQALVERLAEAAAVETFAVPREPDVDLIQRGVIAVRKHEADVVVGFGGGSVIDTAKAIGILAPNDGDLLDYLEVIGRGQPFSRPSLPCVAIPTTAGTGSEVTRNAVLASPAHGLKVSLRSPLMLPRVAIVDPDLTLDLPRSLTATTGLDALTQLIEPYLSRRANPITDALCLDGMRRAALALPAVIRDGHDADARAEMALASLFGGMALANAGLGAVHGFAGPIGGMFGAPHGAVCAALLPHVFRANQRALGARGDRLSLLRFDDVARAVTGIDSATADDGVEWLGNLIADVGIPRLGAYGITAADVPAIVEHARRASSMKANPVELTGDELSRVLTDAL